MPAMQLKVLNNMKNYSGRCLCGHIRYTAEGKPTFPHLCSCTMCAKGAGALTVAWVDFPLETFSWNGAGRKPTFYRSSKKMVRGFCPKCGGTMCSIEDGSDKICMTIATLNEPEAVMPGKQHSYHEEAPSWWKVIIEH